MYNHLTINQCLFSISKEQLEDFKEIASYNHMNETFDGVKVLNDEDKLTTVLQVWCMLNEDKLNLLFIPDKLMPYASNYYILNLLRTSNKVKYFLQYKYDNPNVKYILSYYLTIATLKWCDELMSEYNMNPYFGVFEQPHNYYLFLEDKQIEDTKTDAFYIFQKKWTNLIATDYNTKSRFNRYIDDAINMTKSRLKL